MKSKLIELDYQFSYRLAHILSRDGIARKIVQISTITGTAFFWFFYFILWYLFELTPRDDLVSMLSVFIFMLFPIFVLKQTIRRPRPDFKDTRMGAVLMDEWSFPSGHASRATYVMILMSVYMPNFAIFWIIWGLFMMISRLLLGVHYISDILGGFIITTLILLILFSINLLPIVPWA